jgi:hypothetical protein
MLVDEYMIAPIVKYGFLWLPRIGQASDIKPKRIFKDQGSVCRM